VPRAQGARTRSQWPQPHPHPAVQPQPATKDFQSGPIHSCPSGHDLGLFGGAGCYQHPSASRSSSSSVVPVLYIALYRGCCLAACLVPACCSKLKLAYINSYELNINFGSCLLGHWYPPCAAAYRVRSLPATKRKTHPYFISTKSLWPELPE
jgi:hypothetical protein